MLILAVDTTSPAGSAALLRKTKLLGEINLDSPLTHSERVLPSVDFILKANSLKIGDVDAFAVAVGPGSFTGIRIGLSAVKSFALASNKPVAPVSTLQAMALKLRHPQSRLLCPLIDAKKGEVYAALFESSHGRLREVVDQGAYSPDRFLSLLPSNRIIFFLGSGVDVCRDKIMLLLRDKARFSSRSCFISHEVGELGYTMLKEGKGRDFREVEPLYFRSSQAEERH